MSVKTIEKVKNIEREAKEVEHEYERKLLELKESTEQNIAEMKKVVEANIATFKQDQTEEKEIRLTAVKEKNQKNEQNQLEHLEVQFKQNKDQLVNAVVEEVMSKYGNS